MTGFRTALLATSAMVGLTLAAPAFAANTAAPAADAAAQPADAAQAPAPDAAASGEVTVTARRRNENIVDVPLAITVVTSEKIEKLNLKSTRDIANYTPSLEFSDFTQGNSRNDRGPNRTIIFRGLNLVNNGGTTTQAASMFLDGAAVIGNEIPAGLDIGAVEVLRGPQNVYFGRATMTGAIAYRTKPIPEEMGINANIEVAQRKTYRVEASIAGHLITDMLGVRVTGLYETNDGYIINRYDPSGPELGSRQRKSISGTVDFTPTSSLEIKGYANYFEDEDGPSATVNIFPDAPDAVLATVAGVQNIVTPTTTGVVSNCIRGRDTRVSPASITPARATICGRIPSLKRALAYSRTDIPNNVADVLFGTAKFIRDESFKRMAGTQRHAFNSHAVLNWQASDYLKFQSITGYHTNVTVNFIDGTQQPIRPTSPSSVIFFGSTNKFKDFSQELRLSSDSERPLSWTVGGNYVNANVLSEAYNSVISPAGVFNGAGGAFNIGQNLAKTYGLFAGVYYKMLDDRLTLSAEGRYQSDKRKAQTRAPATFAIVTTSGIFEKTFKAFYPRVSADYDVGGGRKIYASYAQGGRPGGFNSALLSFLDPNNSRYATCGCYTATVAQINSLFGVVDPNFKQEKLSIGELGFKGYLPNNKGYFDVNLYYGTVSNQQVNQGQIITALTPPTTLSIIVNTGKTRISGIEFTGNYRFTPEISLDTTFAWNRTKRLEYLDNAPGNIAIYGRTDYSGLKLPLAPIVTGSAVLSYEEARSDDWSPFGNASLVYRGKQYADIGNLAYIPGRAVVDLRLGLKKDDFRLEAFVTNLFNNKTPPAGNVAPEFGINQTAAGQRATYSGFFGAYAEPSTVGLRFSAGF